MSKKNNLSTRRRQHEFDKRREAADALKKIDKKTRKDPMVQKTRKKRLQKFTVRLKKNVIVKGIKIKDAASKRKAARLLQKAEAAMKDSKEMEE